MKYAASLLLSMLVACASFPGSIEADLLETETSRSRPQEQVELPNLGPAPELENEVWLNTEDPLRLAGLRGKVVLLDMWTFG